jgi:hypothetical protein
MPRIFSKAEFKATGSDINEGDYALIILKEFYVGDNHEWWLNDAEVSISFEFTTGAKNTISKIFSTFQGVPDHAKLPMKDIVLLPPTKVEDYLSLGVNAMEIDSGDSSKLKMIMDTAKTVADKVLEKVPIPGVGAVGAIVTGIVGDIVNLIASLNDDDVIMREIISFVVSDGYPALPNHLKEGELTIKETMTRQQLLAKSSAAAKSKNTSSRTRKFSSTTKDIDKSYVTLQIVKAPGRKPAPPTDDG